MADCKDIDKALAALAKKIDAQNTCCRENKAAIDSLQNKIKELERRISGSNQLGNKDNKNDLIPIYQRLGRLENYINRLDSTGDQIREGLAQIREIFLGE